MDHETDERQRQSTLTHLNLMEARCRAKLARTLLSNLHNHARHLTRADLHDYAYAIWAEFRGDGGRTEFMPRELEAGVFAHASLWLDHETILRLAREAWGDAAVDASDGEDRVQWMPEDDTVIFSVKHLLSDGTPMVADIVVMPGRLAGAVR